MHVTIGRDGDMPISPLRYRGTAVSYWLGKAVIAAKRAIRRFGPLVGVCTLLPAAVASWAGNSFGHIGGELEDDFKYIVDNAQLDLVDVVTAPLHIADSDSPLRSPTFYLGIVGVAALMGGAFALDQTVRSHLHDMSSSDADLLQSLSYGTIGGSTGLLYSYGLAADDSRARQYVLTAGEGAGIAELLTVGIKATFGRLRPIQSSSHTAFFQGGASFVSGEVAPVFGFAAGLSEYFDNRWYVAAPVYSLALLDGFGRIGHDAHWLSDVVGAALLGWGSTELFLYLHDQHAAEPNRWRIFPIAGPSGDSAGEHPTVAMAGIGVEYCW